MKQQKCDSCQHWNINKSRCEKCNHPLIASEYNKDYKTKIAKEDADKEPSKFELFLKKMEHSNNVLIKGAYYFLFSIWTIYMFILSIFVLLAAATPG